MISKLRFMLFLSILFVFAFFSSAATAKVITVGSSGCDHTSIADAISLSATSGDTIDIKAGTYTEGITISKNLIINGAGASSTIVDGNKDHTVFSIASDITVTMSGLMIQNGSYISNSPGGGAIFNEGNLILQNCTISNNSANVTGFGPASSGGIYNSGTLTLQNCTISGNSGYASGGIFNTSSGGIYNSSGTLTIENCTISDNETNNDGGGIFNTVGTSNIKNTIIANNTANGTPNDCAKPNGNVTSGDYNFVETPGNCTFNGTNDITNQDPRLTPITDDNGSTWIYGLLPGSQAIDAGSCDLTLTTDQRGFRRKWDGDNDGTATCDIGAFEATYMAPPGGVGDTDGGSGLELWLKADAIAGFSNSDPITNWLDTSGNNNDLTQTTAGSQPTFITNTTGINDEPVVNFDGTDDYLWGADSSSLDISPTISVFAVVKPTDLTSGILSKGENCATANYSLGIAADGKLVFNGGAQTYTSTGVVSSGYSIASVIVAGSSGNYTFYMGGQSAGYSPANDLTANNDNLDIGRSCGTNYLNGDLAEVIIFSEALNNVKRTIVENYLGAKYGLALSDNDKYTEQAGFTTEVIGIGEDAEGNEYTESTDGELTLTAFSFSGEGYIFSGHNDMDINFIISTDVNVYNQILARAWYIESSGTKPLTTTMKFNIAAKPNTALNYGLIISDAFPITSAGANYTFITADSIDDTNNTVTFKVPSGSLPVTGYYTLGTQNFSTDPLLVTLISFTAKSYPDHVLLNWQTASEIDNAGFHIWRSETKNGNYTRITDNIIPSYALGSVSGAEYVYEDRDVVAGQTYYYKLEDIEYDNDSNFHELSFSQAKMRSNEEELPLDVNDDGEVDIADVIYLLQCLTGIRN
ncbi:putative pectate lyase C (modular protein) [Candidatus Magnetomoraceae bacterium gMMP-15]